MKLSTKVKENIWFTISLSLLVGLSVFTYGIPLIVLVVLAYRAHKQEEVRIMDDLTSSYEWTEVAKELESDELKEEQHDAMQLSMAVNEPYHGQENW